VPLLTEALPRLRVIADLHVHSKYSRATSLDMDMREITANAELKGLGLVGTGDFTHPDWNARLKQSLHQVEDKGVFLPRDARPEVHFIISGEVCTTFVSNNKSRRIHHVILVPSFDIADQINDRLERFGDLRSDGRPTLSMTAAELVEETTSLSDQVFIFPAHIWTPWFSLFGAIGGFDSVKECYEDQSTKIRAVETGLSSDPPMNWRLSALDPYAILSNSDSHSPWPWRIGREATVVSLRELSYPELVSAISSRESATIDFTVETDPAYGKYHWSGHRRCGISMPAQEAIKAGNLCPRCGRRMTKGVDLRVEELADRPAGIMPKKGCVKFVHLLPLHEVIATVTGATGPSTRPVWEIFNRLVNRFGTEYNVMLDATEQDLAAAGSPEVASAIVKVRNDSMPVTPGYDGVYGKMNLKEPSAASPVKPRKTRLDHYM